MTDDSGAATIELCFFPAEPVAVPEIEINGRSFAVLDVDGGGPVLAYVLADGWAQTIWSDESTTSTAPLLCTCGEDDWCDHRAAWREWYDLYVRESSW